MYATQSWSAVISRIRITLLLSQLPLFERSWLLFCKSKKVTEHSSWELTQACHKPLQQPSTIHFSVHMIHQSRRPSQVSGTHVRTTSSAWHTMSMVCRTISLVRTLISLSSLSRMLAHCQSDSVLEHTTAQRAAPTETSTMDGQKQQPTFCSAEEFRKVNGNIGFTFIHEHLTWDASSSDQAVLDARLPSATFGLDTITQIKFKTLGMKWDTILD